ncbi:MAG: hypothetical protein RR595_09815 [Lysinibacillus sp.]
MYKKITLEKFERNNFCQLTEDQFKDVKKEIENTIDALNEGIEEGRDYFLSSYMQGYDRELSGMRRICSTIGISAFVNKEE